MNRNVGILLLLVCALLIATMHRESRAQVVTHDFEPYRCGSWSPPAWDKKGTRRRLFPILFGQSSASVQIEGQFPRDGQNRPGIFQAWGKLWLSLISEPNQQERTFQFVTPAGFEITFFADNRMWSQRVRFGRLPPLRLDQEPRYIDCIKGDSPFALEDDPDRGIADVFAGRRREPSESKPEPSRLGEKFGGETPAPTTPPSAITRSESSSASMKNIAEHGAETPTSVCSLETWPPRKVLSAANVASSQTVGIRNNRIDAAAYDYLSAGGDAIPLDATRINIGDSVGKLVPYEAIAVQHNDTGELLLVSLPGVDESRAQDKGAVVSKPAYLLKVIIVGGAPEIAISGLVEVEAELKKLSHDRIKLSAEWYIVHPSGSITSVGQFESFEKLVKTAAEQAAGRRSDMLNEMQLMKLFDDLESMIMARRDSIQKIFWVKGAYFIPSSIPQRFEKFLSAVSSSDAVAQTPAGRPARWIVLVSERTAGFSINYLKEPIYAQQIGDVIEEGDTPPSGARRLIGDAVLLANRLRISAVLISAGKIPSSSSRIAGRLVLNAKDIYDQRGYLLSAEAATELRGHLDRVIVSDLGRGTTPSQEDLLPWIKKTQKSAQTMTLMDVLQNGDGVAYLRLPKNLPGWVKKPIRDWNDTEARDAQSLIIRYFDGADDVLRNISKNTGSSGCGLFYVPESAFGFR